MGKSQKRKQKTTNDIIAASIYTKTSDPKEDLLYFKQSVQKTKVK